MLQLTLRTTASVLLSIILSLSVAARVVLERWQGLDVKSSGQATVSVGVNLGEANFTTELLTY